MQYLNINKLVLFGYVSLLKKIPFILYHKVCHVFFPSAQFVADNADPTFCQRNLIAISLPVISDLLGASPMTDVTQITLRI